MLHSLNCGSAWGTGGRHRDHTWLCSRRVYTSFACATCLPDPLKYLLLCYCLLFGPYQQCPGLISDSAQGSLLGEHGDDIAPRREFRLSACISPILHLLMCLAAVFNFVIHTWLKTEVFQLEINFMGTVLSFGSFSSSLPQ